MSAPPPAQPGQFPVKYRFSSVQEFIDPHRRGAEAEFQCEKYAVDKFNKAKLRFNAWSITRLPKMQEAATDAKSSVWLFLVQHQKTESTLPDEGESCKISLWKQFSNEKWWVAQRIAMPHSLLGPGTSWDQYIAFKVTVPTEASDSDPKLREVVELDRDYERTSNLTLSSKDKLAVVFELRASSSTLNTELGALRIMAEAKPTDRRGKIFQYWISLRDPAYFVNLFNHLPHLRDPDKIEQPLRDKLASKYKEFDAHQWQAYKNVLKKIPCGVCAVPGGPGAGKTTWNLLVAARAQARDEIIMGPGQEPKSRPVKVLYLIDINRPLNDIANRMVRLYEELGMDKRIMRMYSWNYIMTKSDNWDRETERLELEFHIRNDAAPEPGEINEKVMEAYPEGGHIEFLDFSPTFIEVGRMKRLPIQARVKTREDCLAPTLDDAAWMYYDAMKDSKYSHLREMMDGTLKRGWATDYFKYLVNGLYQDVMERADFIATTPVTASKHLSSKFEPDLVLFDEAPHAREAATLAAIAHFSPLAWIFTGDPRQTRPYVRFEDGKPNSNLPSMSKILKNGPPVNPWRDQMEVSMMERADKLRILHYYLLLNHRACADLHKLPSSLFYDGRMITALDKKLQYPQSTLHLMKWISTMLRTDCKVPRVRVAPGSHVVEVGTGVYNEVYMRWVMKKVEELVRDEEFKQPDGKSRGTILIITPYREAFYRYRSAIRELWSTLDRSFGRNGLHSTCKVEARTIDTAQGHEADVVFLDLVRDHVTKFLDDGYRLNVAITRSRQAEFIIADKMDGLSSRNHYHKSKYFRHIYEGVDHVLRTGT